MTYGERFVLTLCTRDATLAAAADQAGVNRIGVDLERLGKDVRQGGLATWISDHGEADLAMLAAQIPHRRLFARCNPIHAGSKAEVDALCRIPGLSEIHVGLNDLRLSLGWPTHFHVLVSGLLEHLAECILGAGHLLAVGGGRAGDDRLPIPSDLVLAQYPRLGAGGALVSRAFLAGQDAPDLVRDIPRLRQRLDEYAGCSAAWLAARRRELARHVGAPEA